MEIKKAAKIHIEGIISLLKQVQMVHHLGRPDLFKAGQSKYYEEEVLAMLDDPQRPLFVAVDENDQVLGYIFCVFQQYCQSHILTDIKTLYIDDLCVDEKVRGEHIGQQLYEYVLKFAKDNDCYNIVLNVYAFNESAIKFYEKCGLKPQKIGMEKIL